jgi:hypothetical protein
MHPQPLYWLRQIPSAAELSYQDVAELLESAVHSSRLIVEEEDAGLVVGLCKLPTVQQLPFGMLAPILRSARLQNQHVYNALLTTLPGVRASLQDQQFVMQQLADAVQQRNYSAALFLSSLPAAKMLDTAAVEQLMQGALEDKDSNSNSSDTLSCVLAMLRLPEGQQLSSSVVASAMQLAMASHDRAALGKLCKAPAAAQITAADLTSLLRTAVDQCGTTCYGGILAPLCKLPAALQISSSDVAALLCAAIGKVPQHGSSRCIAQLCNLPSAMHISSSDVVTLLCAAIGKVPQHGSSRCIAQLCKLPAAMQISSGEAQGMLQALPATASARHSAPLRQLLAEN